MVCGLRAFCSFFIRLPDQDQQAYQHHGIYQLMLYLQSLVRIKTTLSRCSSHQVNLELNLSLDAVHTYATTTISTTHDPSIPLRSSLHVCTCTCILHLSSQTTNDICTRFSHLLRMEPPFGGRSRIGQVDWTPHNAQQETE